MEHLIKEELFALLRAAKDHRERDWLWILVTYHHGFRISETLSIQKAYVRSGYITMQRLKGSAKTTQKLYAGDDPLLNEAQGLFDYTRNLRPHDALFKLTRRHAHRLFAHYSELAGIPAHKRHPHVLKHTTAMHMLETEKVNTVQKKLGHKSGASTLKYLEVGDSDADAGWERALNSNALID